MAKNKGKNSTEYVIRPPVVTVMGHVDHGKTSILDAFRHTNVQGKEYGGITQHIGAYQIEHNSQKITFIDTPGHAAFSQMRARGGRAADIAILVVAVNEGVLPQTKESITHIKAAGIPMVVALNKIDVQGADQEKIKKELAQEDVLVEDWGGDIVAVPVSAKTGEGLDKLLDAVLAIAEMSQLKAEPNGELEAIIIESRLDTKKGVVVSAIVKNGTIRTGAEVFASGYNAKVKSLTNHLGEPVTEAGPSTPVEVLGFSKAPSVGDLLVSKGSELAELAIDAHRVEIIGKNAKRTVTVVIKADTQGTLEAVKASLANLVTESAGNTFALKFIVASTGDITDSDILTAQASKGIVVGFDVKLSPAIEDLAESLKVPVKTYKTIYDLIDDVKDFLEGTALDAEQKIKGRAQVLKTFKLPSGDIIAGSRVLAGALKEGIRVAIYDKNPSDVKREENPLYIGTIKKLKRGKEDVSVVGKDNECGVLLRPQFEEITEGLWIEAK